MKELADIYRRKLARHVYKITFYVSITIFGYYILKDLPYFPKSMGGKGYMPAMFLPGFPYSYFHQKPPLFNFYYNLSLASFVSDFIFLCLDVLYLRIIRTLNYFDPYKHYEYSLSINKKFLENSNYQY